MAAPALAWFCFYGYVTIVRQIVSVNGKYSRLVLAILQYAVVSTAYSITRRDLGLNPARNIRLDPDAHTWSGRFYHVTSAILFRSDILVSS